ncbi:potassium/sodium hyperpolarization-activated cyclic nucleotide-gated channel 1 [Dermacentor silvarum]|uniref:potassium/sodium hyperpolarization-activated cyclic nucleotide-gated channel 1 n=1 Tax=Dermacentor silvarum TaxID=543639 RepID=UPI002100F7F5|nr:potassium/sodium hyperpolarization-activated cyclic nucleotide-gated channel 1 [Dermacentor silvarum]
MGRKKKRSRRRDKSSSHRTRRSMPSSKPLLEQSAPDTQALSYLNQTHAPTSPGHLEEPSAADEMQVKWAPEPAQVRSSSDQMQAQSSEEQPRKERKSSKASKSSRASHGVSWGEVCETNVQTEGADASQDHASPTSAAAREHIDSEPPAKEIDKDVERRLVAMFKRQLKTFLFPPRKRQGFVFPLDYEDRSILDGRSIREERHFPWMIHPKTTFRNAWDLCMLVMSFASVILVPLNMAYFESVQEERLEWRLFNIASDLLFFADVIFNFRTGIPMKEDHGRINMDPEYVAVQYRRGWFYVDSFCCLPLDYTAMVVLHTGDSADDPSATSAYPSILRINKLLALPKIGRLTAIIRNLADVEENFFVYSKGVYVRLLFHLGLLFLLIHWHGCLQYYVDRLEGFPSNSWVARLDLVNASWPVQYSWSVYGSSSMMLGVGMGAIEADNAPDSWLRCGCMATGHALQALLVGACIDMITSMNFTRLRNRQKIRDLDDYMQYKMLPLNLRRRIRDYAENRFKGRVFDENQIIQSLSDPLREVRSSGEDMRDLLSASGLTPPVLHRRPEKWLVSAGHVESSQANSRVMWHNCRRVLRNVPFFARAEPDFLRDLTARMKMEFFVPNEVVAAAGTMGDRLYLLQSGSAHVVDDMGITVATVMPGDRFGEVCLLRDTLRLRTVIADCYCHFFSLTRSDFNEVLARHPDVRDIW